MNRTNMNRTTAALFAVALSATTLAGYADSPTKRGANADGKSAPTVTKPSVTPTASEPGMPGAIRGRPESNRLQDLDRKAKQLKRQVQSLQTSVTRSGWDNKRQAGGTKSIQSAIVALGRDVKALQDNNASAQFQTGKRLAMDLQQQLTQIGGAAKTLGAARDTNTASGALTQIAASLDNVIRSLETLPPCCTERICCHVGFQ